MEIRSTRLITFLVLLAFAATTNAQELAQIVSVNYSNQPLGDVLADISRNYDVKFSYSADYIPLNRRVWINVKEEKLSKALDDICDQTSVAYRPIGGQIVLKLDQDKNKTSSLELGMLKPKPLPKTVPQTSPIYSEAPPADRKTTSPFSPIERRSIKNLPGGNKVVELDAEIIEITPRISSPDFLTFGDNRLAQVSLLPFLGTNADKSEYITNNVSVNVFWGTNGGVDGIEVGGFVNTIVEDVKGVQVAGLGNTVAGDVTGTQVGGLFNTGKGKMEGLQLAGLFNVSGETSAFQASGMFNVVTGATSGVQASGLFNIAGQAKEATQASGLFNVSGGNASSQVSGLFNVGRDISWGQISSLINVGRKVDGFQVGLINVADSVSGLPIGILNFIRHGYNKVELAGGESLFANFGLKLGVKGFYNIIQLGARWDDLERNNGGEQINGTFMSWGLGYGLGTAITFSPRVLMNFEVISMHINETEAWTRELNQLNQVKLLVDVRMGRKSSVFLGPVGNLMISKLYNPDTQSYGSIITPYALYEETSAKGVNTKMWVGFTGGIRF